VFLNSVFWRNFASEKRRLAKRAWDSGTLIITTEEAHHRQAPLAPFFGACTFDLPREAETERETRIPQALDFWKAPKGRGGGGGGGGGASVRSNPR
jgi:hypothetical protein